jgi:adenylate kinase
MHIVFLGAPGSGKGTQTQRLKDYLGITHISTGELLRAAVQADTPLGREADRFMRAGRLVPDNIVFGVVVDRLDNPDCAQGCLFDGFPRTVPQAEAFDRLLNERGTPLDLAIALNVSEKQLMERLLSRGRPDDARETILERFRQYTDLTTPLRDYYRQRGILREIAAGGTPDQVFADVRDAVASVT